MLTTITRNYLAGALTTVAIIWIAASNFFPEYTFGLAGTIYLEQYAAALLAVAFPIAFLGWDIRGYLREPEEAAGPNAEMEGDAAPLKYYQRRVPLYDLAFAAIAFFVTLYVAIFFPEISENLLRRTVPNLAVAAVLILLVLEAVRRTSGSGIMIVVIAFFVLALVGHLLPQDISGRHVTIDRYSYFLAWDSTAIFGVASQIISTTVVAFVLFGTLLFAAGGGKFFTDLSMTLMGRFRGGQGKIAVLASSLFGSISGSVVANVATTGVLTIPMMKKAGFKPQTAGAIEAVASTGGQLLPPMMGIAAFILAEFLQIPYAEVATAALVPALLFYIAIFIQVDLDAAKNNLRGLAKDELPDARVVFRNGWFYVIPFVVLLLGLFTWRFPPESAALLGAAALLVVVPIFGRNSSNFSVSRVWRALVDTGYSMTPMVLIGAAAGVVIATLNYTGMGFGLSLALVTLAGGHLLVLLILVAVASIILGMGLPTVGVYVLLATLVAPALIELGLEPLPAHLFILYYGCLSMITPPVAIGAFAAANIAKAPAMATGWEAVRVGWMIFVIPFLFVSSDTLLLRASILMNIIDIAAVVVGIWLISSGLAGVFINLRGRLFSSLAILSGACLLLPAHSIPYSRMLNIGGLMLAAAMIALAFSRRARRKAVAE